MMPFSLTVYLKPYSYMAFESNIDLKDASCPTAWVAEQIEAWLLSLTSSVNQGQALHATIDIFEQGFDRYGFLK